MSEHDTYKAMLFGIALFVSGIAVAIILLRIFQQPQPLAYPAKILQSVEQPIVDIRPATELVPAGEVMDLNVNVSDKITELYMATDGFPWTSFDMDNLGPDPVYMCVNKWISPEAAIAGGGTIHIDLKRRGAIKKIYLKCDQGKNANISFYIVR